MPLFDSARTGRTRHPAWLVLIYSLWIATVCNIPLWREWSRMPELQSLRGLAVGAGFAITIAAAMVLLFSLLNWRWTLKPAITLSLFAAAFGAHFMLSYGVVIDSTMLVNALETDLRETRDLVNTQMLLTVLVMAVVPTVWLWRQRSPRRSALRQIGGNLLTAVLALGGGGGQPAADFSRFFIADAQPHRAALPDQPAELVLRVGRHCRPTLQARRAYDFADWPGCPVDRCAGQAAAALAGGG